MRAAYFSDQGQAEPVVLEIPKDQYTPDFRERIPEDGSVPGFPEWRWIHTPGHSDGHVSLFREQDRTLIAGHAFVTTKQESFLAAMTQRPELHGPPAYFTTDWDAVATGHGKPLAGADVANTLDTLARDFDRVARPEHGRYVNDHAS
jgi:glyoxylase-like metal-dependent hydrolase (beta-lactamase superfamily II)